LSPLSLSIIVISLSLLFYYSIEKKGKEILVTMRLLVLVLLSFALLAQSAHESGRRRFGNQRVRDIAPICLDTHSYVCERERERERELSPLPSPTSLSPFLLCRAVEGDHIHMTQCFTNDTVQGFVHEADGTIKLLPEKKLCLTGKSDLVSLIPPPPPFSLCVPLSL
jgi:hypothetical protein